MEGISGNSFCCGTLYGFIAAGIIAAILVQIRDARFKLDHKDRPLDKFPEQNGIAKRSNRRLSDCRQKDLDIYRTSDTSINQ